MHKKDQGTIGELAISLDLMRRGYHVFSSVGDNSRVDIIALVGSAPIRIQVKSSYSRDGKLSIGNRKTGPGGYSYKYSAEDFDVLAVYDSATGRFGYVSSKEATLPSTMISFRLDEPAGKNGIPPRMLSDYSSFERALRDYTPPTLTITEG